MLDSVRRDALVAGLALVAVLVQIDVLPVFPVLGVVPDVVVVTVAAVALRLGPRAGAVYGFAAGLFLDMFLRPPAGLSACAYTLAGHAVGTGRTMLQRRSRLQEAFVTALASLGAGSVYVVLGALFGQEFLWSWRSARILVVRALLDGGLALLVLPLVARALRAHLDVAGSYR